MTPYLLRYVQIDRKGSDISGNPELTHVYSFFALSKKHNSLFKYIIRVEKYEDCFAIKYYCTRNKHSEFKYSRVLNLFDAIETKRIMETCASVIPIILKSYPDASFVFNGSRTHDSGNYVESTSKTQRYRIYIELVRRLFGQEVFDIKYYDDSSSCIFVNRKANADTRAAARRIFIMFSEIYLIEI